MNQWMANRLECSHVPDSVEESVQRLYRRRQIWNLTVGAGVGRSLRCSVDPEHRAPPAEHAALREGNTHYGSWTVFTLDGPSYAPFDALF